MAKSVADREFTLSDLFRQVFYDGRSGVVIVGNGQIHIAGAEDEHICQKVAIVDLY